MKCPKCGKGEVQVYDQVAAVVVVYATSDGLVELALYAGCLLRLW